LGLAGARDGDPGGAVGHHGQARAVESVRAGLPEDVGLAELGFGVGEDLPGGAGGQGAEGGLLAYGAAGGGDRLGAPGGVAGGLVQDVGLWGRGRYWHEAGRDDLLDWEAWRRWDQPGRRISGSRWQWELAVLRLLYEWAEKREHIGRSPGSTPRDAAARWHRRSGCGPGAAGAIPELMTTAARNALPGNSAAIRRHNGPAR
jgi:hypothetical protein